MEWLTKALHGLDSSMTIVLALLGALIAFLLSVTVILFIVGPTILLHPRRRTAEFYRSLGLPVTPDEAGLPFEKIAVEVSPDVSLDCWLIRAQAPAAGTLLYLHGVGDCKIDGIRFAKLFHQRNFHVFLFDSRRHGESGGSYCTYGYYERSDLSKLIDYLSGRKDIDLGKIGMFGTSMGAAVALQSAALDPRVSAVVAENSFATLRTIFDDYQKRIIKLPFHYLRNIVIKRSEYLANFKARDVSPLESVKNIRIPLLFIYGSEDHLISYRYSVRLYEAANEPKSLFPIEKAKHNDVWNVAGVAYETRLLEFFSTHLS